MSEAPAPAALDLAPAARAPTLLRPARLRNRAEFLAVSKGIRITRGPFTLQALRRPCDVRIGPSPRIGFTVTKKVGNAVVRNRIRRRLRACAAAFAGEFQPSTDYVIVARLDAFSAPFDGLARELSAALSAAGRKLDRPPPAPRSERHERP